MDFAVKESELGSPYTASSGTARHGHSSLSSPLGAHQQQTHRETHLCPSLYRHQGWKDETDPHQLVTFSREALNYDFDDRCLHKWIHISLVFVFFPGTDTSQFKKYRQKYPLLFLLYAPENWEEKQERHKNNVINVCSEGCSWTSADAQDLNQSLALSQITPQNWSASLWIILRRGKNPAVV